MKALDPGAERFCIDEKTAIQALDRRDRVLPLSPGRVELFLSTPRWAARRRHDQWAVGSRR